MRKRILILILVACTFTFVHARVLSLTASIDSAQIWIGQQANITFEYTQEPGKLIQTPVFSDTIIGGIELVQRLKPDTVEADNGNIVVKQTYTITAFEDSLYLLRSFPFIDGKDTSWTNQLSLKVIQPFVIDTTKQQITDVKDVFKPHYSLWYILKLILPWFIGILLLALIVILIIRYLKKKKDNVPVAPELLIPAWEYALQKLEDIRKEKLWQQNRHKEYHTQLTDVLREYIERVFGVQAMEMTSEEVLNHLVFLKKENAAAFQVLGNILHLADLIKFAKWNVAQEEHELSLNQTIKFVNLTKPVEEVKENVVS